MQKFIYGTQTLDRTWMWMKGYVGGNLKNKIRGRVNPALMDRCYCLETLPGRQLAKRPFSPKRAALMAFRAPVFKLCGFQARVNLGFSIISSVTYMSRCAPTQGARGCVLPCFCRPVFAGPGRALKGPNYPSWLVAQYYQVQDCQMVQVDLRSRAEETLGSRT